MDGNQKRSIAHFFFLMLANINNCREELVWDLFQLPTDHWRKGAENRVIKLINQAIPCRT
jgi:hypothetical protein